MAAEATASQSFQICSPSFSFFDRVTPRKAGLPAQPSRQPVREKPQHGALGCNPVPGHGNYLCVTTATATTITTSPCGAALRPRTPLPGASWTGRASSLPCSRYPIPWQLPAPWGPQGTPFFEGGGRWRTEPRGPPELGEEAGLEPPGMCTHYALHPYFVIFYRTVQGMS